MQQCRICNEIKELSEFYFRKDSGKYRNECRECLKEKFKQYNSTHADSVALQQKTWRDNNKERVFEVKKEYRKDHKEEITIYLGTYRIVNKEQISLKNKEYRENNKEPVALAKKKCHDKRIKSDINYKLARSLRRRLNDAIHGGFKSGSAVRDLGCSIEELKGYIESLFKTGMTWDNWGFYGWHIDHIIPLASFDLTDREQFLKACHYTNLQPLWAEENLKKGSKIKY